MKRPSEVRVRENSSQESFNIIHYIPLDSGSYPEAARALVHACNRLPFRLKSSDLEALLRWEDDGAVATYEEPIDPQDVEKSCPKVNFARHNDICEEVRKAWNEMFKKFIITAKAIEEMARRGAIQWEPEYYVWLTKLLARNSTSR
jgi:hypothetical protein